MERIAQERHEEDMEVVLRLTRATLALLQDEVREPRTQATAFAALLPRTASVVQYPNIHTTSAIRVLLSYLVDRFWWSPALWRYFLTTLYPDDPISTISQHACTGSTHLFEQEEVNVYAEVITMATLIKDSFRNLVIKQSEENSAPAWDINYLTCAIKEVREKLSLIVPHVEKDRHAGLLGVTGYSKPLAALFCYLLYVDCLFFQIRHCQLPNESDMVEEQVEDIRCHLFQLQKVPALHPILHAVLSPTGLFSLQLDLGTANVSTKQTTALENGLTISSWGVWQEAKLSWGRASSHSGTINHFWDAFFGIVSPRDLPTGPVTRYAWAYPIGRSQHDAVLNLFGSAYSPSLIVTDNLRLNSLPRRNEQGLPNCGRESAGSPRQVNEVKSYPHHQVCDGGSFTCGKVVTKST
ncbi:hypothetical protein Bbelb_375420 [Branchiostoma belcheri]|nr:hypothetical protein Bbelb_375420 [Branchiostoma belcheri]